MKNIIKSLFLLTAVMMTSCEGLVEGINDDPNGITISDVDAQLFLTGAMLANSVSQAGHLNRISGLWSGQLVGLASVYSNAYNYNISTAETESTWNALYIGVIPNLRHIRNELPNDRLLQGITRVIEAHAIGTAASRFGDVPYSEVNQEEIADPVFDGQVSVIDAAISLLDQGISDLSAAGGRSISEDIYYNGDATKWIEAANTLKARYFMYKKDYPSAYTAAQNGISSSANTMSFMPQGDASVSIGDKNLFNEILANSRAGDIGSVGSFLESLIDPASASYRGNAKTDETARSAYYKIDETGPSGNLGIVEQFEPHQLVSFEENHLILAEAGARASFATGLMHLNEYRAWLDGGGRLNSNFSGMPYNYDAYVEADFQAGGMENMDNIDQTRALLREIVEERYVSGFGEMMPFDDARRLRKNDTDIQVPFVPNTGSQHAERFPYADNELNSNSNGPAEDPGVFVKTAVNQ